MTRRLGALVLVVLVAVTVAAVWQGCGGSDHHHGTTFTGNVTSVNSATASIERPSGFVAVARRAFSSTAHAQSSCAGARLIVCATNGGTSPVICAPVDADTCQFDFAFDVADDFSSGKVGFFDDTNGNGQADTGEPFSLLTNDIRPVCAGSTVILSDVAIDFSRFSATAATVDKDPDTCGATPTPSGTPATPTPTASPNPTVTGTPTVTPHITGTPIGTPTPTATGTPYYQGTSLNEPPSTAMAFLLGIGALCVIVPIRRSRRRS